MSAQRQTSTPKAAALPVAGGGVSRRRAAACGVLLAGLTVTAVGLQARPASAHAALVHTVPAPGARLVTAPDRVQLIFGEPVRREFADIEVSGPDGKSWSVGAITTSGATVTRSLVPLGPDGTYDVSYRVVSDDGHPVTGTVTFVMTTASGPAGSTAAPSSTGGASTGSSRPGILNSADAVPTRPSEMAAGRDVGPLEAVAVGVSALAGLGWLARHLQRRRAPAAISKTP